MKRLAIAACFLLAAAGFASAHPGMTDRYDGHKCFKKCEDWGVLYGEYHLHDKDRRPIRITKKPKPAKPPKHSPGPVAASNSVEVQPVAALAPVAPVRQVVIVREESFLPVNPLLLLLLALLILLLVLRMNRERKG